MTLLVTPSDGLFMTIYTKLTLSRNVYESFPADFRPFSGNFPLSLSSCKKGSMLIFVRFPETFHSVFRERPKHIHNQPICIGCWIVFCRMFFKKHFFWFFFKGLVARSNSMALFKWLKAVPFLFYNSMATQVIIHPQRTENQFSYFITVQQFRWRDNKVLAPREVIAGSMNFTLSYFFLPRSLFFCFDFLWPKFSLAKISSFSICVWYHCLSLDEFVSS